ncbi:NADPH-dependent F420 reductase [Geodermatophilus sp. URMC 63]
MTIGILGTGHIGKTLALRLPEAGHEVKAANSRGPQAIGQDVLATGTRAVTAADAVADVDVVIVSVPVGRLPEVAPLVRDLPDDVVVIDTSNYYPTRDGAIEALDAGQVESVWVAQQLGRTVVKAWNSIGSDSLASKGQPAGTPGRIALPVAADHDEDRRIGMQLVEDTGFDAFDAGTLTQSLAAAARHAVLLHGSDPCGAVRCLGRGRCRTGAPTARPGHRRRHGADGGPFEEPRCGVLRPPQPRSLHVMRRPARDRTRPSPPGRTACPALGCERRTASGLTG